jgi:hypothetical protein
MFFAEQLARGKCSFSKAEECNRRGTGVEMKFITRKGAPNIPLQLIEAQESGDLVFFCGAGISSLAGLPGFASLVSRVYADLGETELELEREAKRAHLYDRVLGLLERRMVSGIVRQSIIKHLIISEGADLRVHKALLQISETKHKRYRLVTTNVDHGFLRSGLITREMIDAAPTLPVPKPHKWETIVHLHGIIEHDDPNGENLVFTSSDFGSAYLTERWASRFVTDLFRNFTAVFVGYGVNDPVLRYMTDAIAAERLHGFQGFKQPYVIAQTSPSKRIENENAWKAKGIEAVLYEGSHRNLYDTLIEWAGYVRDGVNAKARLVRKIAPIAPLPPYDEDPSVVRLIDVLREKPRPDKEEVTGFPARVLRELDDPAAPIEWLQIFLKEGLFFLAQKSDRVWPVSPNSYEYNLVQPNRISHELWRWLLHHLSSDVLVRWVIDQGACLHPFFKEMVARHIAENPPPGAYLRFWRIVTSGQMNQKGSDLDAYRCVLNLRNGIDPLSIAELSKLMEPRFGLRKSIEWPDILAREDADRGERPVYEIRVDIGLSYTEYEEIRKIESYPDRMLTLLLPSTLFLNKALEMWEYADSANERHDPSQLALASISPHPQNKPYYSWAILIEMSRDLWIAAWNRDRALAQSVFDLWRSLKYPVFRRLVLHVLSVSDAMGQNDTVAYVLGSDGWWIWSPETRREVFRLLAVLWPKLSEANSNILMEDILKGPPRDMFREDLGESEWNELKDQEIWLMLAKLQSFGRALPTSAAVIYEKLVAEHNELQLQPEERDEFSHWMQTWSGHEVDISLNELFAKPAPSIVECLSQSDSQFIEGRLELFRAGSKTNSEKTIEVMKHLADKGLWNSKVWSASLVGLAECDDNTWKEVAPMLGGAPPDLYREEAWTIAFWARKSSSPITCGSEEEQYFWPIFKALLDNAPDSGEPDRQGEAVAYAINHPIGIITEALMHRFGAYNLKVGDGIASDRLRGCLDKLVNSRERTVIAGKIIIASRLPYFYAVDPSWTREHLLPLFDWEHSGWAAYVWQGYLWNARISADLARELREGLIESVKHADKFGDQVTTRLFQLIASICLECPDLYKAQEQHDVLAEMKSEGLAHIAELFWLTLKDDPESADNYWRNRIRPFMKKAWPKAATFISEKTSSYLSLMAIELNESFSECVDSIMPLLQPLDNLSFLLGRLKDKRLPDTQPRQVLRLLSAVFVSTDRYPFPDFRDVLNRLVQGDAGIAEERDYKRMNDYLLLHRL